MNSTKRIGEEFDFLEEQDQRTIREHSRPVNMGEQAPHHKDRSHVTLIDRDIDNTRRAKHLDAFLRESVADQTMMIGDGDRVDLAAMPGVFGELGLVGGRRVNSVHIPRDEEIWCIAGETFPALSSEGRSAMRKWAVARAGNILADTNKGLAIPSGVIVISGGTQIPNFVEEKLSAKAIVPDGATFAPDEEMFVVYSGDCQVQSDGKSVAHLFAASGERGVIFEGQAFTGKASASLVALRAGFEAQTGKLSDFEGDEREAVERWLIEQFLEKLQIARSTWEKEASVK